MKLKKMTMTVAAAAVTCGTMALVGSALGEESPVWKSPFSYDTARNVSALTDDSLPAISKVDAARLHRMVADVPRSETDDLGPTLDDMPDFSTGRVLLDDPNVARLAGVASERGDVCVAHSFDSKPIDSTCFQKIRDENGTALVSGYDGDSKYIFGIYAPDVTSISVQTDDGEISKASMSGNVFAWRNAAATPAKLIVVRDGTTFETDLAPAHV